MVQKPEGGREPIAGPETPEQPYPLRLRGPVIKGFGRGSKENPQRLTPSTLGIPTANIPLEGLSIAGHTDLPSGVYYGWASLDYSTIPSSSTTTTTSTDPSTHPAPQQPQQSSNHAVADLEDAASDAHASPLTSQTRNNRTVYPTVLSIGYNPYYANPTRSIEIHILSRFPSDFYGATLSLLILGYIRPEYDYVSLEALVEDIREDIRVAQRSLGREKYLELRRDEWLEGEGKMSADEKKAALAGSAEKGGLHPHGVCMTDS